MHLPLTHLRPDWNYLKSHRNWDQTIRKSSQSSVNLGSFLTLFHLLQLSFFSFGFHYNWHLLFRFFFSTRSHQAVECPTLASFQPSEFDICLCQRENGAFSYRYFSFHWWKESLWFIGDVLSFIITADTAEGKDKLLSTQPYSGTSLWEKILLPAWSTLNRMWMSTS